MTEILERDQIFYQQLKDWLDAEAREAGGPSAAAYPVIFNSDGSINRQATLELACYGGSGIQP